MIEKPHGARPSQVGASFRSRQRSMTVATQALVMSTSTPVA
jgi:hypothetical protein